MALSCLSCTPQQPRRTPGLGAPGRGVFSSCLVVVRLTLGRSGVLPAVSATADLASRLEQVGLTLSWVSLHPAELGIIIALLDGEEAC